MIAAIKNEVDLRVHLQLVTAWVCLSFVGGCDKDCVEAPPIDDSPTVLHQVPIDSSPVDAIWGQLETRSVTVQFGDPQGFEDLATALVSVEGVNVIGVIGRDYRGPSDMGGSCNGTGAEYGETLPFDLELMLPASLGGLSGSAVTLVDGFVDLSGILCFSEWCETNFLHAGLLTTDSEALGPSVEGGCTTSIALIGVYPPVREPVSDIIITRLQLEFVNVSVVAYDASGKSATATWPSLRVNYSHPAEVP